jgi:microcompartment protein CcmL/EutN
MMQALGFVEISGVTAAVDALDIMCKSADVEFVTWERKLGGRLVTIIVTGNISAVTAAVENADKMAIKKTGRVRGYCKSARGNAQTR